MFLSLRKEGFRVIRTLVQFNGKFKAAEWHRLQSVVLSKNDFWPQFGPTDSSLRCLVKSQLASISGPQTKVCATLRFEIWDIERASARIKL